MEASQSGSLEDQERGDGNCSFLSLYLRRAQYRGVFPGVFAFPRPGAGAQIHQQGEPGLCFGLSGETGSLASRNRCRSQQGVSGRPGKGTGFQRPKIADCVYLKPVTISHRLTPPGCVCGWKDLSAQSLPQAGCGGDGSVCPWVCPEWRGGASPVSPGPGFQAVARQHASCAWRGGSPVLGKDLEPLASGFSLERSHSLGPRMGRTHSGGSRRKPLGAGQPVTPAHPRSPHPCSCSPVS